MGKYLKKSKIAVQRLRSDSDEDADSFRYLQLRSRRLLKVPLLADTKKHQKQLIPRAKSVIDTEEENFDLESGDRSKRDSEAIESVPSSSEIEDFFAYAEQQQERFFIEKYNFDILSDNPLPGRYEWVKVEP